MCSHGWLQTVNNAGSTLWVQFWSGWCRQNWEKMRNSMTAIALAQWTSTDRKRSATPGVPCCIAPETVVIGCAAIQASAKTTVFFSFLIVLSSPVQHVRQANSCR